MANSHYSDVIMRVMASQIIGVSIVCSTACSGADQRKHQSSASLVFVRGIHRWPVDYPHKGPVTRKMFPFDDAIMIVLINICVTMIDTANQCSYNICIETIPVEITLVLIVIVGTRQLLHSATLKWRYLKLMKPYVLTIWTMPVSPGIYYFQGEWWFA